MNVFLDIHNHNFMINITLINMLILKDLNVLVEKMRRMIESKEVFMTWEYLRTDVDFQDGNLQNVQ